MGVHEPAQLLLFSSCLPPPQLIGSSHFLSQHSNSTVSRHSTYSVRDSIGSMKATYSLAACLPTLPCRRTSTRRPPPCQPPPRQPPPLRPPPLKSGLVERALLFRRWTPRLCCSRTSIYAPVSVPPIRVRNSFNDARSLALGIWGHNVLRASVSLPLRTRSVLSSCLGTARSERLYEGPPGLRIYSRSDLIRNLHYVWGKVG